MITAILGPPLTRTREKKAMALRVRCFCPSGSVHFALNMSQFLWQLCACLEGALDIVRSYVPLPVAETYS